MTHFLLNCVWAVVGTLCYPGRYARSLLLTIAIGVIVRS